jgi:hypothetical protein
VTDANFETVAPRGVWHELPNTAGTFGGERGGYSTAFDQNDSAELDGQAFLAKDGFQHRPEFLDAMNRCPKLENRAPLNMGNLCAADGRFVRRTHPSLGC